jgi:hypothetical protein
MKSGFAGNDDTIQRLHGGQISFDFSNSISFVFNLMVISTDTTTTTTTTTTTATKTTSNWFLFACCCGVFYSKICSPFRNWILS